MFTSKTSKLCENAESLLRTRRYEDVIALCQRGLQRGRAPFELRLLLGRALIALHRNGEAIALLTECLSLDPTCAEAYRMLGQLALRHNEYPRAIQLLQAASQLAPDDESLRFELSVTRGMQRRGHPSEEDEITVMTVAPEYVAAAPMQRLALAPRGHARPAFVLGLLLVGALPAWSALDRPQPVIVRRPAAVAAVAKPAPEPPAALTPPAEWTRSLAADVWMHPLQGPVRRMPTRDSRTFGAERPGDRPGECRSGHCGVDLGETWGEPIRAAHEGVVERVQRGPNPDHGGLYVRLAHRDGTVLTEYFHLAAIPRGIAPGRFVKAGEVVGLMGDSGVKQSGPHLHFALLMRPEKGGPEHYVDPEPLVALWPLFVPERSAVDASVAAGLPRGSKHGKKRARRQARAARVARDAS